MPLLHPTQIRRLVFYAFLLALATALLCLYSAPRSADRAAVETPAPDLSDAPPPPPSPFQPGARIFHGALEDVADFTTLKALDEEPDYRLLVDHALGLDEAGLRGQSEGELDYRTYLKHAPELRGRVFRVSGVAVADVAPERLAEPVRGREDVYRLYLMALEGPGGYVCDLVERPERIEKTDKVELEGLFYKVLRYENTRGESRDAPLFIARTVRRPLAAPATASRKLFAFKLAIATGIAATLVIAWFLFRRMARTRYVSAPRRARRPPAGPA